MKFGEFKNLVERRNELMDMNSKLAEIEIRAINKKFEDISGIPDEVYIKKFYKVLEDFCKMEVGCNLVVVKYLNGVRNLYVSDKEQSYRVLSYFPKEKMIKMDFLWSRNNMEIYALIKKYPVLKEMFWKCISEEIKYRKENDGYIRPLVIQ